MRRLTTVPVVPLHERRVVHMPERKLEAQSNRPGSMEPHTPGGSEGAHLIRPMQGPRLLERRYYRCPLPWHRPSLLRYRIPNPPVWVIWALNSTKFIQKVSSPLFSICDSEFPLPVIPVEFVVCFHCFFCHPSATPCHLHKQSRLARCLLHLPVYTRAFSSSDPLQPFNKHCIRAFFDSELRIGHWPPIGLRRKLSSAPRHLRDHTN